MHKRYRNRVSFSSGAIADILQAEDAIAVFNFTLEGRITEVSAIRYT
ncbi:MAG: hypothetical protein AB1861_29075 [Cyanobacteriota bacterium]